MKKILILGGGTFEPIRNHLSLSAPAFGTTARKIYDLIKDRSNSEMVLTKMADHRSSLITNDDVDIYLNTVLKDTNIGCIILNIAFCDFKSLPVDGIDCGWHSQRLETKNGNLSISLTPTEKVIAKIRKERPDIFLVGFKTTTNKTSDEQFAIALKMMKSVKCNLVLANDTVTRNNMIITSEETIYGEGDNRDYSLKELCDITLLRYDLTYDRSKFIEGKSFDISKTSNSFQDVVSFLIQNKGFIENNGNGFTPGHFCYKVSDNSFLSSQRKANHNLVFSEGLSLVSVVDDKFEVYGKRKASVGARSQWLILKENESFDCIIHTHNPLLPSSQIPIAEQRPFQCGSLECGMNTVSNMKEFLNGEVKAVYLSKHGMNLLFKSTSDPKTIIDFIKSNILLGTKVK